MAEYLVTVRESYTRPVFVQATSKREARRLASDPSNWVDAGDHDLVTVYVTSAPVELQHGD
jgi:hypothetical protein